MNSVGYCGTLGPQLRDDEALVVENAIRLAVDSIVNVLFGVNSARAREYHRVVSDRDKEIQRLETRLRETEEELEVLRQLGCGCGGNGTQRILRRSPDSGDLRAAEQSGPEAVCEDSEEPEQHHQQQQQQQHCEMTLTLGLYAEPHVSPPSVESTTLHSSHSRRMEKENSGATRAFAPSGMACGRSVPPSAGAPIVVKEEPHDINSVLIKWEMNEDGAQAPPESTHATSVANVESGDGTHFGEIPHVDVQALRMNTSEQISKTLVLVRCRQQLMFVTLEEADEHFDFHKFNEQVVEKFFLPPDSKIVYKDDARTEVDADVFSRFFSLGNPALTVFLHRDASDGFTAPPSDTCDSTVQTVPRKRKRDEEVSAKQTLMKKCRPCCCCCISSRLQQVNDHQRSASVTPWKDSSSFRRKRKKSARTSEPTNDALSLKRAAWRAASRRYYARKVARQQLRPSQPTSFLQMGFSTPMLQDSQRAAARGYYGRKGALNQPGDPQGANMDSGHSEGILCS